ncbi:MAG: sigma 54-interacting transcriptional regulator [Isosphaeraceae bacterium]
MTIADLIGEVDMIKHAEGRYLSSELTMHFGLIPRTNRGIFCINELPDLAPKIQVGLFNVLEERDIQIRGYPIRLELDVCMVFSANPEDYTNRGRIVTPLKDRIGSVVRTHYPLTREIGIAISEQNAWLDRTGTDGQSTGSLAIPLYVKEVVEEASRLARSSPHVNQQSGVSVRMSIANLENVVSNAERRAHVHGESWIVPRVSDLAHAAASSRGKLELTMNEDEGHEDKLIHRILDEAVKNIFTAHFDVREFRPIVDHFESGQSLEVGDMLPVKAVLDRIARVPGLRKRADEFGTTLLPDLKDRAARDAVTASVAEFILEGLHVHNKLNKAVKAGGTTYRR